MDVGAWLRSIGLGQYEAAFHQNQVDYDLLPKLTSEDLKDLGVVAVGHRRKILDAIASLAALEPALACFGHGKPLRDPRKLADFVARLPQ